MTTILLVRLVYQAVRPTPAVPFAAPAAIDLNAAGIPTLMTLPGVGRTRATAIVLHRVRHGRFRKLGDLQNVDGFGSLSLVRIRPFLAPIGRDR